MPELPIFSLDVLPPKCAVEAQGRGWPHSLEFRFRAERPAGRWRRRRVQSAWSGWFVYDGEPIALKWETFWL